MISNDLAALVFELQRSQSVGEKAKVLARAWRTLRGLSGSERRLLAREVGFDGAEDLVEGLAGKGGGAFAPAAVLEALGKMRRDKNLSVRGILSDLKNPDRRDDLLVRGMDLAADVLDDEADDPGDPVWTDGEVDLEVPIPSPDQEPSSRELGEHHFEPGPPPLPVIEVESVDTDEKSEPTQPAEEVRAQTSIPEADEPDSALEDADRTWDELWLEGPVETPEAALDRRPGGSWIGARTEQPGEVTGSVLDRLQEFRGAISTLRSGGRGAVIAALETLPEPWAKRRALVALIEAGGFDEIGSILDLVEDMDRPMDRRWCLTALARRGDLDGGELARALGMLTSSAARRRVVALASRAG